MTEVSGFPEEHKPMTDWNVVERHFGVITTHTVLSAGNKQTCYVLGIDLNKRLLSFH